MVLRNAIIEAKLVEQPALIPPPPPHHRRIPRRRSPQQTESPFGAALNAEGIEGVFGGYPFFPTDNPWHREAIVYGSSGLPWSILGTTFGFGSL